MPSHTVRHCKLSLLCLFTIAPAISGCSPTPPTSVTPAAGAPIPASVDGEAPTSGIDDGQTPSPTNAMLSPDRSSVGETAGPTPSLPDDAGDAGQQTASGGGSDQAIGLPNAAQRPDEPGSEPGGVAESDRKDVDCALRLPCAGSVDGGAMRLELKALRQTVDRLGIEVRYSVASTRDTTLDWQARDDSRTEELELLAREVSGEPISADRPHTSLVAGEVLDVVEHYALDTDDEAVDVVNYRLSIEEAGRVLAVYFRQVPVEQSVPATIDCGDRLPCNWSSLDGRQVVTLVLAEQLPDSGDVVVVYYLESDSVATAIVGQQSSALTIEDTALVTGLHSLNEVASSEVVEHALAPGSSLRGIQDFQAMAPTSSLRRLTLDLGVEGEPSGRRPTFRSVPVQN